MFSSSKFESFWQQKDSDIALTIKDLAIFQFSCCGVNGHKDWTNKTIIPDGMFPDERKRLVPAR